MRGCNVEIFQPFSKLAAEKQCLHKVGVEVGLIELNKFKKEDKESVAPSEKCEVPYLCMTNIPESVLSILVEGDRSQTHYRHPWMSHDTWDLLWAGDMGASSTKFGFFNTRQLKFLSGTKLNICSMFEQPPDSPENMTTVYSQQIAPGIAEFKDKCSVRVQVMSKSKFAGALVPFKIPILIGGLM